MEKIQEDMDKQKDTKVDYKEWENKKVRWRPVSLMERRARKKRKEEQRMFLIRIALPIV